MNALVMILLQAGLNIAQAHTGPGGGGEAIKTGGFILDAARAIDDLYQEEYGEPLDWSTIRHHEHLPPSGEAPTLPGMADVANPSQEDPGE